MRGYKIHSLNEIQKAAEGQRKLMKITGTILIALGMVCFIVGLQICGQVLIG